MRKKQGGFTLLELVVTIIILGLMLGMGLPSMSKMIQSSKVSEATNSLVRDFHLARSAASDLNAYVTLCRRRGTTQSCKGAGNGAGWEQEGWLVFVDSVAPYGVPDTAGEFILITDPIDSATIRHNATSGNTFNGTVRFAPDGTVRDSNYRLAEVNFDICPLSGSAKGRTIEMNNRGSVRTSKAIDFTGGRGC